MSEHEPSSHIYKSAAPAPHVHEGAAPCDCLTIEQHLSRCEGVSATCGWVGVAVLAQPHRDGLADGLADWLHEPRPSDCEAAR